MVAINGGPLKNPFFQLYEKYVEMFQSQGNPSEGLDQLATQQLQAVFDSVEKKKRGRAIPSISQLKETCAQLLEDEFGVRRAFGVDPKDKRILPNGSVCQMLASTQLLWIGILRGVTATCRCTLLMRNASTEETFTRVEYEEEES